MKTPKTKEQAATCLPAKPATLAARRVEEIGQLRGARAELEQEVEQVTGYTSDPANRELSWRRRALNEQIVALEMMGDGGPLLTVTLDAYGSTLVRRSLDYGHAPEAADVVNGALSFALGADDDHDWPEEAEKAAMRREGGVNERDECSIPIPAGHAVTIRLTPVQMRMLVQVADDDGTRTMPEIVLRELGEHVAHMLECFHGHNLDAVQKRWNGESEKEVA